MFTLKLKEVPNHFLRIMSLSHPKSINTQVEFSLNKVCEILGGKTLSMLCFCQTYWHCVGEKVGKRITIQNSRAQGKPQPCLNRVSNPVALQNSSSRGWHANCAAQAFREPL